MAVAGGGSANSIRYDGMVACPLFSFGSLLAESDAAHTLTGAQSIGKWITLAETAARTLTTDTAANILAAISKPQIGDTYLLVLNNTGAGGHNITLAGGTNVSVVGTATVANNAIGTFLANIIDNTGAANPSITYWRIA